MIPHYFNKSLKELFSNNTSLIDVRSPVEFEQGAFPSAVNLPVLDNEQRREVGICYKEHGQEAAIELGHTLVSGTDKREKMEKWIAEIKKHPDAVIYCFRGGLRSKITQGWLREAGVNIPIIEGGYKRLRNYLLANLEEQVEANSFLVISGNTGSGKTEILNNLSTKGHRAIDLEGLANHRGSAFGEEATPQPSQVDFDRAGF